GRSGPVLARARPRQLRRAGGAVPLRRQRRLLPPLVPVRRVHGRPLRSWRALRPGAQHLYHVPGDDAAGGGDAGSSRLASTPASTLREAQISVGSWARGVTVPRPPPEPDVRVSPHPAPR